MTDIYIYGEIGGDAENFASKLNGAADGVVIHINSPGGDVMDAIAMGNAIKSYAGEAKCIVEGLCASAAMIISSSCKRVEVAANSLMMIHPVSVLLTENFNSAELAVVQEALSKVQAAYEATIQARLKQEIDLSMETWFSAAEAVEYGLADAIVGSANVQIDAAQGLIYSNKCVFKAQVPLRTAKASDDLALRQIIALIKDQMFSGAMKVKGSQNAPTAREMRIAGVAAKANRLRK